MQGLKTNISPFLRPCRSILPVKLFVGAGIDRAIREVSISVIFFTTGVGTGRGAGCQAISLQAGGPMHACKVPIPCAFLPRMAPTPNGPELLTPPFLQAATIYKTTDHHKKQQQLRYSSSGACTTEIDQRIFPKRSLESEEQAAKWVTKKRRESACRSIVASHPFLPQTAFLGTNLIYPIELISLLSLPIA